jgi:hypothetical protein
MLFGIMTTLMPIALNLLWMADVWSGECFLWSFPPG